MISRTRRAAAIAAAGIALATVAACVPETPPATTTTAPPATTQPPAVAAAAFSSTEALEQLGSSVTVTGSGFDTALITAPGTPADVAVAGVYVALGIGDGPVPTAYTSAKYIRPSGPEVETTSGARLNADGSFSATIATPALFAGQGTAVNCYIDACKVFVWSAHTGSVASWSFSEPVTFAAATTKQIVLSTTTGLTDGATIGLVGAGFAPGSPGLWLSMVPFTPETAAEGWQNAINIPAWGPTRWLPGGTGLTAAGTFSTTLELQQVIGTPPVDCAATGCSIASVRANLWPDVDGVQTTLTPITFAAPAA